MDVPFLLATIDARDKTIAERDAEIERLRRLFGPVVESAKALVTDYRGQIEAHSRLMRQIREPFHAALNTPDEAVVRALEERDAEIGRLRRLATKAGRYIETAARIIEEDSLSADDDDTADALEFAAELIEAGTR